MNLSWTSDITIPVKKALMLFYFSGQNSLAKLFYRRVTESITTSNITNWAVRDRTGRLCRGWLKLPRTSVGHIDQAPGHISEVMRWHRSQDTPKDSTRPSHNLFTLLSSGKQYRSVHCQQTTVFFLRLWDLLTHPLHSKIKKKFKKWYRMIN